MRLVRVTVLVSLIASSLSNAPVTLAAHQDTACAAENRDQAVGDPANVVVEYDPRTLVDEVFGDRDATAQAIANEIRAEGETARSRYIQLGLPTPALRIKLQCRTLDINGVDLGRPITLGPDNIQLPVREIEDAFLEGIVAPGPALGSGEPWQDPTAAWRDTVRHEAFHAVQMELWVAFGGGYTFRNYFLFQNITASESTATLAQDLFSGVDDTADAPVDSYREKTERFFADRPTIEAFNSDDQAYQAGAVFQYWAERFGPNQGDDLERRVADFSRLLVGTNRIRTEAMEEALGRDVFEALRDFYVTAYIHDRAQAPGPYAFLDEITAHGATPGVGVGQEYPTLTTVSRALADADFPGQLLGQGRGEVYEIGLPPATASVEVALQSRPTGGVEVFGAKVGQNWSPLRTAFVTVDASGSATIDPALMPNGPHPIDGLTTYTVDVAGKSELGVIVVAGEDDADYDLRVQSAGLASVSIVVPTLAGPRVIGPAADLEEFEVIVDASLNAAPPGALKASDFAVTVGGLSATVKSVLPTIPGRFNLLVEPPATLADGRHPLSVDFFGDVDSEADAIIVGEAPSAAVSLVIDKSGSMGGSRITAAKAAAVQFVDQMQLNDYVALVTFDSSAYINKPLTLLANETVRQQVIDAINAITAGGLTNIAAGLDTGNQQLAGAGGTGASRAILLLSDGLDSSDVDAVIAQIPADVDAHTIALDSGSDQARLQHIAEATGGVYLFAPSGADLANLYSLIRARITSTELRQLSLATLGQGESASTTFPIAAGAHTAAISLVWAGSNFDLSLELPSGRTITETTEAADVVVRSGADFVTIEVSDPEPGEWQATALGVDVPTPEEVTLRIEERGSNVAAALAVEAVGSAGAPIVARLALTGADGPVAGAEVTALLQRPDASTAAVRMFDDGGHGDGYAEDGVYGTSMSSTAMTGSYTVTVEAAGIDAGFDFVRQEVASIFLAPGTDTDSDGITDETELRLGLDPTDPTDATADLDSDGLGTLAELGGETDPLRRDTDGGGESDGSETGASRNPLQQTDDFDFPEVFVRVVPEDGRFFSVYTMTSTATDSVHIERVGPSQITDLGTFAGAEQSLTDGPLPAGTYSYRVSAVASGAESAPIVVGPFEAVDDATPPTVTLELNGGVWQATSSAVPVELVTSEPVSEMRFAPTLEALAGATWQPFTAQFSLSIGDDPGIKRLYVEVRDAAGNTSEPAVDAVNRSVGETTELVSISTTRAKGNGASQDAYISGDGRYVVFHSDATNLDPADTNNLRDAFVHDRVTGTTALVSASAPGVVGNGPSDDPAISADGRSVTFRSQASNLVAGDTNGTAWDIFVKDLVSGAVERVSVVGSGVQANGASHNPVVSADGRYVAFRSSASNLVSGDTNGQQDVFVRDRQTATTTRVSVTDGGTQATGGASDDPAISADGRFVVFQSDATNLVAGDSNAVTDIFVRDRTAATTVRVSLDSAGVQADGRSSDPAISADGATVVYESDAPNLVAGDTNAKEDIFVHTLATGLTVRASVADSGGQATKGSGDASISSDGTLVAFYSTAANLVSGDTNNRGDVFIRDLGAGTTVRKSLTAAGDQANEASSEPWMSADGSAVAFQSVATNLVPEDTDSTNDVYVRGPSLAD